MLIDLEMLVRKYNMKIDGVLHCGAHLAEERFVYQKLGLRPVYWVEGDTNTLRALGANLKPFERHVLVDAVLAEESKMVTFHHANNGMSSSILELGLHKKEYPSIRYTETFERLAVSIDELVELGEIQQCNFVNLDLQGAELIVLKGASDYLQNVDYIYSEVNIKQLYKEGCLMKELDDFLKLFGFKRMETKMTDNGWGDALFIRKGLK